MVSGMSIFLVMAAVFALSVWLTGRFCDPTSVFHVLDHPNERSLHDRPTPRTGGLAIVAATVVGSVAVGVLRGANTEVLSLLAPALVVAGISLVDDHYSINTALRLLVHVGVAVLLVVLGYRLPGEVWPGVVWDWPGAVVAAATVFYVVWMLNLYNFMDGMDGFAAGMAITGFGGMATVASLAGHAGFATMSAMVAVAAGGFLTFNFPPARIFMGDVGSSFLGVMAAGLSLQGAANGAVPFWISILLFSPFIVDATFTLFRRAVHGERVWVAHRSHIYQRLVQIGWGHRRTVLAEYVLMLACLVTALVGINRSVELQRMIAVAWLVVYAGLIAGATSLERRARGAGGLGRQA